MPYLLSFLRFFFFNDTATTEIYTLSLHDALPICPGDRDERPDRAARGIHAGDRRTEPDGEGPRGRRQVLVPREIERLHVERVRTLRQPGEGRGGRGRERGEGASVQAPRELEIAHRGEVVGAAEGEGGGGNVDLAARAAGDERVRRRVIHYHDARGGGRVPSSVGGCRPERVGAVGHGRAVKRTGRRHRGRRRRKPGRQRRGQRLAVGTEPKARDAAAAVGRLRLHRDRLTDVGIARGLHKGHRRRLRVRHGLLRRPCRTGPPGRRWRS